MSSNAEKAPSTVELLASDLIGPGVITCPNPKMPLWSNHPKVFLDVAISNGVKCPYCSTTYRLKDGEHVRGHH